MAYCIRCGKEINDDRKYCDEHSVTSLNSEQIMPNISFVSGENQQKPDFSVDKQGTVAAQFSNGVPPQNAGYTPPAKKPPLWLFPVFALVSSVASGLITFLSSLLFNGLTNLLYGYIDTDYLYYTNFIPGSILSVAVFFVCAFASVIVYNKICRKNGLEKDIFPVYYGAINYVCSALSGVVRNLLTGLVMFVGSIISNYTYSGVYSYDVYSVVNAVSGFINGILFVGLTFITFTVIHKKQIKNKK